MRKLRHMRKAALQAALIGVIASVAGVVQLTGATPADAVKPPDLHRVQSPVETSDFTPGYKVAVAVCPPGEWVVGGGGWAYDDGAGRVRLTGLVPGGTPAVTFNAYAEAPRGFSGDWWLQAYAICAPQSSLADAGYEIARTPHTPDSGYSTAAFREETAACPGSKRALGTGAAIDVRGWPTGRTDGQVGVTLTRTSGPMDISRAQARADANYGGPIRAWRLTSYAVCVNRLPGQRAQTELFPGESWEDTGCPTVNGRRTYVHGAGGGAGGQSWLMEVYPTGSLGDVEVSTTTGGDGLLAHAACAY